MASPKAYGADDIFSVQIEAIQRDLEKHLLDINRLKPSGRLAARALVEEGRAATVIYAGRLVLEYRDNRSLLRFFLLGSTG